MSHAHLNRKTYITGHKIMIQYIITQTSDKFVCKVYNPLTSYTDLDMIVILDVNPTRKPQYKEINQPFIQLFNILYTNIINEN